MNTFSPTAMIRFGWETFKKRPWFFIGVFLVISILSGGSQFQYQTNNPTDFTPSVSVVVAIVAGVLIIAVIQILAKMGAIQFALRAHDNADTVSFHDVWAPHPFWKYVGASILVGVIVVTGLILLIVPGIIWALRYMFVPYLVVERKLAPFEALKESARITYGHKWQLLGMIGLIIAVYILGFLCLIVGLLVSGPVSAFAIAHAYRTLSAEAGTQAA